MLIPDSNRLWFSCIETHYKLSGILFLVVRFKCCLDKIHTTVYMIENCCCDISRPDYIDESLPDSLEQEGHFFIDAVYSICSIFFTRYSTDLINTVKNYQRCSTLYKSRPDTPLSSCRVQPNLQIEGALISFDDVVLPAS